MRLNATSIAVCSILLLVFTGCGEGTQHDSTGSVQSQSNSHRERASRQTPTRRVKPKGVFRVERVKTGEVVCTLDGMVVGFGPDAYSTKFEYAENAFAEIPVGGETTPMGENNSPIGRAVRVVSGGELVTEAEGEQEVRYYRLNDVLYCGDATCKRVLYYKPIGSDAKIHRLIADGRWETRFTYEGHPLMSLPTLTTKDLNTGEVVYRAFDLEPIRTNVMRVREEYYRQGKVVSELVTERATGLGILLDIKSISGPIPRNYFAFDFVLSDWPFGRSMGGFGGF